MNNPELPKTDSIAGLAAFWQTHDLTDFEDQLEEAPDGVFRRMEATYTFTLILSAAPDETLSEQMYRLFDDGTIATIAGVPQIAFHRQAASLIEAIRSAIADVRKASLDVIRVEITPDAVLRAS